MRPAWCAAPSPRAAGRQHRDAGSAAAPPTPPPLGRRRQVRPPAECVLSTTWARLRTLEARTQPLAVPVKLLGHLRAWQIRTRLMTVLSVIGSWSPVGPSPSTCVNRSSGRRCGASRLQGAAARLQPVPSRWICTERAARTAPDNLAAVPSRVLVGPVQHRLRVAPVNPRDVVVGPVVTQRRAPLTGAVTGLLPQAFPGVRTPVRPASTVRAPLSAHAEPAP